FSRGGVAGWFAFQFVRGMASILSLPPRYDPTFGRFNDGLSYGIFTNSQQGSIMSNEVVAIIGGTGALGTGLARRWRAAGYPVILGYRPQDMDVQVHCAAPRLVLVG